MAISETSNARRTRSTADAQRARIIAHAVPSFALSGFRATPVSDIAAAAGVSPAYVFRLFGDKLGLFVAAVGDCYRQVENVMADAADATTAADPQGILAAMTDAYVELVSDRDLIMLQAQAQSACDVAEIRLAVQEGLRSLVEVLFERSHADPVDIQRAIAYAQLCHLIVQADLGSIEAPWAQAVSAGIRHGEQVR